MKDDTNDLAKALEHEKNAAFAAISHMQRLDNEAFVAYVRSVYDKRPDWLSLVLWEQQVRRELDMRLLLK